jgi:hypothetical protein
MRSQYLHAETIAYPDVPTQTLHICRLSDYDGPIPFTASRQGQRLSATSPDSSPATINSPSDTPDNSDKKSKVARPPNAFILYRKHYHPSVKAENPDLHNNDISVMLGKQWNAEPENVKAEYRIRAQKIKKQHAIDNPGYQYAPRKPSEKKRRMTTKKAAKLKSATEQASPLSHTSNSTQSTPDALDFGFDDSFFNTPIDGQMFLDMPAPAMSLGEQLAQQTATTSTTLVPFNEDLQPNQLSNDATTQNTNQQSFIDGIIDWTGIQSDAQLVFGSTLVESDALAQTETADQFLTYNGMTDAEFAAELQRVSEMM